MVDSHQKSERSAIFREPGQKARLDARRLAGELSIAPLLAQILVGRGIISSPEAERFLGPRLSHLIPPEQMADFDKAVARVADAVLSQQKVGVFGDYDVDGITSAAVVALTLESLGCPVYVRIAHRQHGYGLQVHEIDEFLAKGCDLLVACDVGSSDEPALRSARERGLDVVVLDHHQVPEEMPPAVALVNPARPDCGFPDENMASVGLAFYLAAGLKTFLEPKLERRPIPDPRTFLDLVALGTVADVAPLKGANRVMVSRGLQLLGGKRRPGLQALARVSGVSGRSGPIGVREVAFRLAPRLNAAGRLGDAMPAFALLREEDEQRAKKLAGQLDELNRKRQELQEVVFKAARQQVEWGEAGENVLVVDGPGWHPGVVGIVAAKLAEKYARPAVVISIDESGEGRGSCRTAGGVNIYRCLESAKDALVSFGGHEAAAGVVVRRERIELLRSLLEDAVSARSEGPKDGRVIEVDGRVTLKDVDQTLMTSLDKLEPMGSGNPEPVLLARSVGVERIRVVGQGHLSLQLAEPSSTVRRAAIGFRMADRPIREGSRIDIAFTPEWDTYRGNGAVRLRLKELVHSRSKDQGGEEQ